ncbi:MAG: thermonuclease family protein [Alphaproteobacteria bacterium]|nr:thermonuclease family protein [Alphaproteobacteria bacterium]
MLDVFLLLAVLVGLACLAAFTPGDDVEKAVRPVNIALLGAIGGALLALTVVAVGLGGVSKRRVHLNMIAAEDVFDGDTIRMGDASLRLWGIDAPERSQVCRDHIGAPYPCGELARNHLVYLLVLEGKLARCGRPDSLFAGKSPPPAPELQETFGRPLVSCEIHENGQSVDLATQIALAGFADVYRDEGKIKTSEQIRSAVTSAQSAKLGMWAGWTLAPEDWRNDKPCRERFKEERWSAPDESGPVQSCALPHEAAEF